jgi:hypothetical protein
LEYWEAAALIGTAVSTGYAAFRGASKKSENIEKQLRPQNGEGTLAEQVNRMSGKIDMIHDTLLDTRDIAVLSKEIATDVHQALLLLPCKLETCSFESED